MIFIEHSHYDEVSVKKNMGAPQYSYYFVRKAFAPALDRLGRRVSVTDPAREVDAIHRDARERGEDCVFLSYNPPHEAAISDQCPTVIVFAWEYDTIPDEEWDDNPRHDWRKTLSQVAGAVTLSRDSAGAVRRAMGDGYPVWAIPSPLFDSYAGRQRPLSGWRERFDLNVDGTLTINARDIDLSLFRPDSTSGGAIGALRWLNQAAAQSSRTLSLRGVIYVAVLSPTDSRKNWRDLIAGFVWAFRDNRDATLIVKITHSNVEDGLAKMLRFISVLPKFECSVILMQGMLAKKAYDDLIEASSYCVNVATAEGQCLPLTEYMSSGRPAVAPAHSSLLDFVSPTNAFVVASDIQPSIWPHDERMAMRCRHHVVNFSDLVRQYFDSFRVAKTDPARYLRMSRAAVQTMQAYCSEEVVAAQLSEVMQHVRARREVAQAI